MIIFKKTAALMLCLLIMCTVLTACQSENKYYSPSQITEKIMVYTDSGISWAPLTLDTLSGYFGFSGENINEFSAFVNDSEEGYDIVAAFEFRDKEALTNSVGKLTEALDGAIKNFAEARESESVKLKQRNILIKDNMLVVVVCANNEKIEDMLKDMGFSE